MFGIFNRKTSAKIHRDFRFLKTDMHSHLIPGIDDGSESLAMSLSLLMGMEDLGYERVITTPHVRPDYFPNTRDNILQGFSLLKKEARKAKLNLKLDCAAEYFIDHDFEEKVDSGELLTFSGNHVLIELSTFSPPPHLEASIFKLKIKGYQPVLAHPERYVYFKRLEDFEEVKEYGCLFQLNLLSLTGHYGKTVKDLSRKLMKANMIDFLGTDMHHQRHLESIQKMRADRSFMKLLSKQQFLNSGL